MDSSLDVFQTRVRFLTNGKIDQKKTAQNSHCLQPIGPVANELSVL